MSSVNTTSANRASSCCTTPADDHRRAILLVGVLVGNALALAARRRGGVTWSPGARRPPGPRAGNNCDDGLVAKVVDLLQRPLYGLPQVDRILGLRSGTARRWIDGYDRGGKHYPPVVRDHSTGADIATWGEFVETRLLSEYRDAGVPLIRMRPTIEKLREELNTPYPLASARTWLSVEGRELVRRIQDEVDLERPLALVVRTGQEILWTKPADDFRLSVEWSGEDDQAEPRLLRPVHDIQQVVVDPTHGFGEPVVRNGQVRGVRTEIIAELVRAGDTPDMIADLYDLPRHTVDAAVRYELKRAG